MVGPIDLETLFGIGKRRRETGVVEHGGQVEQFGIRCHGEPVSVELAEQENPARVVLDERACGLLNETSRFVDRRGVGNLQTRNDSGHDFCAFCWWLSDCL